MPRCSSTFFNSRIPLAVCRRNSQNSIEVLPLSSFDDRIRIATYRAIYRNVNFTQDAIQPVPPIHIIVKNGDVTLVGMVATQGDRDIANISARSVPGVFSVTKELRVA